MRECIGIRGGFWAAGCDYFGARDAVKLIRFKANGHDYAIAPTAVMWFTEDNTVDGAETTSVGLAHGGAMFVPMSFAAFAEAWERAMESAPAVMP